MNNTYPAGGYVPPYQYMPQAPIYGNMMGNYTQYPVNNTQPVMTNFLTPEQQQELMVNPQVFPTKLTRDEYLRSICSHKSNNRITLEKQQDGQSHCSVCQADFYLFELNTPDETINGICKNMHDLLQSIKTYMLNAPEALKDIYMMLGFIQKLPLLWKTAVKSFESATNVSTFGMQGDPNANTFQVLGNLFGSGIIPGGGYYQQNPMPAMAMYQQPMYSQPGFGALPNQAPPPAPMQPNPYANQQYGFNAYQPQQPNGVAANGYGAPPQYAPNPASNPIGYVDNSQMTTQNVQIGGQPVQQPMTQPTSVPNPNIQAPPPPPPVTVDKK